MVESGANDVATSPEGPFDWITLGSNPLVYPISVIAFTLGQMVDLPHNQWLQNLQLPKFEVLEQQQSDLPKGQR